MNNKIIIPTLKNQNLSRTSLTQDKKLSATATQHFYDVFNSLHKYIGDKNLAEMDTVKEDLQYVRFSNLHITLFCRMNNNNQHTAANFNISENAVYIHDNIRDTHDVYFYMPSKQNVDYFRGLVNIYHASKNVNCKADENDYNHLAKKFEEGLRNKGNSPPVGAVIVHYLGLEFWDNSSGSRKGHANYLVMKKTSEVEWRYFIIEPYAPSESILSSKTTYYKTVQNNIGQMLEYVNTKLGVFLNIRPYNSDVAFYNPRKIILDKKTKKLFYDLDSKGNKKPNTTGGIQKVFDRGADTGFCIYFATYLLIIYLLNHTRLTIVDVHSIVLKILSVSDCGKVMGSNYSKEVGCVYSIGFNLMYSLSPIVAFEHNNYTFVRRSNDMIRDIENMDSQNFKSIKMNITKNGTVTMKNKLARNKPTSVRDWAKSKKMRSGTIARFRNDITKKRERERKQKLTSKRQKVFMDETSE